LTRNFRPLKGEFNFRKSLDVDFSAYSACLKEPVSLDIYRLINKSGFLKREASALCDNFSGRCDKASAIVNGSSCFVPKKIGIDVSCSKSARSLYDKLLTNFLLSESEVRGRGVEDNVNAAPGKESPGAIRNPGVFTDLEAYANASQFKNRIAYGEVEFAEFVSHDHPLWPCVKPAGLVVKTIARKVLFCNEAFDFAINENCDGIIDRVFDPNWKTDSNHHFFGVLGDFDKALP
jgi:hypothetical protein